jgi:hypothetical protein
MHQDVNSNSRGSLLTKMEVETDSDVPEFSLPPKSIVKRPKKTIRKRYIYTSWFYRLYVWFRWIYSICVLNDIWRQLWEFFYVLELDQGGENIVKNVVAIVVVFFWPSLCVLVYWVSRCYFGFLSDCTEMLRIYLADLQLK